MLKPFFFIVITALTAGSYSAHAADPAAGKTKYASSCAQCHGPSGKGMASFPSLAGRDAEYISNRLKQYRAGEKVGSNSGLMIPNASKLSDAEIANLAAYISQDFQ